MQDKKSGIKYEEILDELQVQSWQLELVISGFAIFGLFSSLEPLFEFAIDKKLEGSKLQFIFLYTIYISCLLAIVNLIIHVLLRGLWIGAVGIRSVSGDIDFEALNISKVFKAHLQKKIGTFDRYIISLENYSSILFGVTFLIAFITIALALNFIIFIFCFMFFWESDFFPFELKAILGFLLIPAFILGHLITLIDFILPGIVKRSQDVAKAYLPIYKIFSVLTLSFIYRPILYNLLDNKFGKKIIYSLIPLYGILLFFYSLKLNESNFFDPYEQSSNQVAFRRNYKDMISRNGDYIGYAAISSKIITQPFPEITIPYSKYLEDDIIEYDTLLRPQSDARGYESSIINFFKRKKDTLGIGSNEYLQTINEMFHFQIDGTDLVSELVVVSNKNEKLDLEMFVDLLGYSRGKHLLTIKHKELKGDSIPTIDYETIPFWYFPEDNRTTPMTNIRVDSLSTK
ncbi:hypothetical protein BFP77_13360 [Maribacter sp. 4U21]|uniref:hypothetical protein n=1 Tax=Maribacter sp. 4U21 TaxID=1889779 RepID=UPI000C150089|nr:hypothetical protein [Maribacter sp. 4U21]PIB27022.1 hypothetical protein BFP77_13360 [Maribacter sp. 4U21]